MPIATVISEQGARGHMEDFHFLDLDFSGIGTIFGGVYDGHSGSYAARYAAETLHLYFLDSAKEGVSPSGAFCSAYQKVSDDLKHQDSGTTAATFLLEKMRIHIANAGDSRIIVVGDDYVTQLTIDHRLDNAEEFKRILLSGGKIDYPYVMKGIRGLMPTRSLGDEYFRDAGVIPTPATFVHEIRDRDGWLVAATDGLFDEMDNETVARLCREHTEPRLLAETLIREVLTGCAMPDNTTVILVKLD
ncbi:MAG TPA: protein serine/threonine phosphatase 2C family protein [Desulfobacteraceae bacterium]|nr:protein serine/threonine phosphatase 2C family protein [Desulfobacteraceae bacterium]